MITLKLTSLGRLTNTPGILHETFTSVDPRFVMNLGDLIPRF